MSNQAQRFLDWLDAREAEKGFSDYEVAKRGGFSHSVISRARAGFPPGWEVCVQISKVFDVSPITVFRQAGLLPDEGNESISFEDWKHIIQQLPEHEQEEMRQIAIMKIERARQEESTARSKQFREKKSKK